jgi:hypothetical protein
VLAPPPLRRAGLAPVPAHREHRRRRMRPRTTSISAMLRSARPVVEWSGPTVRRASSCAARRYSSARTCCGDDGRVCQHARGLPSDHGRRTSLVDMYRLPSAPNVLATSGC